MNQKIINLLLKAAKLIDARSPPKAQKRVVEIKHLASMLKGMKRGDEAMELCVMVALVAFWGMARLGELLLLNLGKTVRLRDLMMLKDKQELTIGLRGGKTAKPGEIQYLHLRQCKSILDLVGAVERLLRKHLEKGADEEAALFTYYDKGDVATVFSKGCLMGSLRKA